MKKLVDSQEVDLDEPNKWGQTPIQQSKLYNHTSLLSAISPSLVIKEEPPIVADQNVPEQR